MSAAALSLDHHSLQGSHPQGQGKGSHYHHMHSLLRLTHVMLMSVFSLPVCSNEWVFPYICVPLLPLVSFLTIPSPLSHLLFSLFLSLSSPPLISLSPVQDNKVVIQQMVTSVLYYLSVMCIAKYSSILSHEEHSKLFCNTTYIHNVSAVHVEYVT